MTEINFVEKTVRGWLKGGIQISHIVIGMHNACVHGDAIENGEINDNNLGKLFEGFDISIKAAREIDGE